MDHDQKKSSNDIIIDWEQCLKLANNKADLAKDLLLILLEELPVARTNIDSAYANKNFRELYQYVHKLHGASCYCGVPRLRTLIATIEEQLKVSNTDALENLLHKLNDEIDNIQLAFNKIDFNNI